MVHSTTSFSPLCILVLQSGATIFLSTDRQVLVLQICEAGLTQDVCCCRWGAQRGCKLPRSPALLLPPETACGCMPCLEHEDLFSTQRFR